MKILPTGFATLPLEGQAESGQQDVGIAQQAPGNDVPATSLCDLSDDQIVKFYISDAQFGVVQDSAPEEFCKVKSEEILDSLSSYRFEAAKCRADAALECEAKKQAFNNCSSFSKDPSNVAQFVVEKQCRRVAAPPIVKPDDRLYQVSEKWQVKDPAFADQLGETADTKAQEKKNLDALSYVFGNGDYGSKLKERAAKLRELKDKLIASGTSDAQTIASLEAQAQDFEAEAGRFSNAFDITRIGDFFAG